MIYLILDNSLTHFDLYIIFHGFHRTKSMASIQYGYRNCVTHAGELPPTLAHGNRKNEKRKRIGRKMITNKRE